MEVKTIIKQKGFTMEAVAKKMGITRVTLAQNLSRNPTVGTLQKIADVIGCKVGDFFVDDMDIKDDTNTIICPHCGGKIHFMENHVCRNIRIYEGRNTINKERRIKAIKKDSARMPVVSIDIFSDMAIISSENPSAKKEYINAIVSVIVIK